MSMRIEVALLSALLALGLSAANSHAVLAQSPWPMRGGNAQHTGRAAVNGPLTQPEIYWSAPGMEQGGVAIDSNGDLLVLAASGLQRYSPRGTLLWTTPIGLGSYATPAIDTDGTVYIAPHTHSTTSTPGATSLTAVRADGTVKWRQPAGFYGGTLASPLITQAGLIVHAPTYHGLSAYRADGSLAWRRDSSRYYIASPAESLDGQTIYAVDDTFELEAINAATGELRWDRGTRSRSSPTVATDGTIYLGTDRSSVLALRPDGSTRWEFEIAGPFDDFFASPALQSDGTVIACSTNGTIYALDPADGSVAWSRQVEGAGSATPLIGANDAIYLQAGTAFRAFTSSGGDLWSLPTISLTSASQPAIGADGSLYVVQRYQGAPRLIAIPEPSGLMGVAGVLAGWGVRGQRTRQC